MATDCPEAHGSDMILGPPQPIQTQSKSKEDRLALDPPTASNENHMQLMQGPSRVVLCTGTWVLSARSHT